MVVNDDIATDCEFGVEGPNCIRGGLVQIAVQAKGCELFDRRSG
jgi:hypothetical protein